MPFIAGSPADWCAAEGDDVKARCHGCQLSCGLEQLQDTHLQDRYSVKAVPMRYRVLPYMPSATGKVMDGQKGSFSGTSMLATAAAVAVSAATAAGSAITAAVTAAAAARTGRGKDFSFSKNKKKRTPLLRMSSEAVGKGYLHVVESAALAGVHGAAHVQQQ